MRLFEGEVSTARRRIVDVKNEVAKEILAQLRKIGLRRPKSEFAEEGSDDAIIYIEAGNNHLIPSTQTVMIRVVTDIDIQIQLPHQLAQLITMSDFFQAETVAETMSVIKRIASGIRAEITAKGYGPNITVGSIGENPR